MKKFILFALLALPFAGKCFTYTSKATGNWDAATSWSSSDGGTTWPKTGDNATIQAGNTITLPVSGSSVDHVNNLIVNGTISNGGHQLWISGLLTNAGTISSSGNFVFTAANATVVTGAGSWASFTGIVYFTASNESIASSCNIVANQAILNILTNLARVSVINNGTVSVTRVRNNSTMKSSCWTNAANATLTVKTASINEANDTLIASAAGNTVIYAGTGYTLTKPLNSTYYNLTGSTTSTLTMPASLIITNNLLVTNGTFDATATNYNLTVGGNITNNKALNNRSNTVTLNGSGVQTISGTGTLTFYNLTENGTGTGTLGKTITISKNFTITTGTFDCQAYQIVGNSTGTLTMASGTTFKLGTTASIANVLFPTNYTAAHITLNSASTVEYLANQSAQVISVTPPSYGNLLIDAGSATAKPLGGNLIVTGNLTVNANPILSAGSDNVTVTGNATITGGATFTSGNFTVGGNVTTGSLTVATGTTSITGTLNNSGTITYSGAGTLSVTGATTNTSTISMGTGTFNETGAITNSGTLSFTTGPLNIKGNFTNNSTFTAGTGNVTFNGASTQSVGGSAATAFYDVTVNGSGIKLTNNSLSVTDAITPTSGTVSANAGDTLLMVANAGSTARIGVVGGSITAVFKMQQYINRTTAEYGYWASPAQSETVGDLNNNRSPKFYMSGVGGPDGKAGSFVSVEKYVEPAATYSLITKYVTPGINYVFKPAEGLLIWIGNSESGMSPSVFHSNGVPTYGNVNFAVTYTASAGSYAGHMLVGNPYDSPLSWASFYAANSSLMASNSFYILEQSGSSQAFTSGSIADNQGFNCDVNANGTLHFTEAQKTATPGSFLRPLRPEDADGDPTHTANGITLTLANDANDYSCPTTVIFGSQYENGYNGMEDAIYYESPIDDVPQLFTTEKISGNHLIVNRMPDNSDVVELPLTGVCKVAANYSMTISGLDKFTSYQCVSLVDGTTGAILNNFNTNPTYTFVASADNESHSFVLRFTKTSGACEQPAGIASIPASTDNITIVPSQQGATVNFYLSQPQQATISVYNMLGEKVSQDIQTQAYNNQVQLQLASGQLYIVRVQTANGATIKKLYH